MQTSYNRIYTTEQANAIIDEIDDKMDSSIYVCEALMGGATLESNVVSRDFDIVIDDIEDSKLGLVISHIHKEGTGASPYGKNFKLSLDERLERILTEEDKLYYVHTDARGNKRLFEERFYKINKNGNHSSIVNTSLIKANPDGTLWLSGERVYRELVSKSGARVVAELAGVNNSEWIETRENEVKALEEEREKYKKEFVNYLFPSLYSFLSKI